MAFCDRVGRHPFPAREDTIILFITRLHLDGLAPGTMKSYLAAVRYEQIRRGLGDPEISEAQTSYYSSNPGQVEGSLE